MTIPEIFKYLPALKVPSFKIFDTFFLWNCFTADLASLTKALSAISTKTKVIANTMILQITICCSTAGLLDAPLNVDNTTALVPILQAKTKIAKINFLFMFFMLLSFADVRKMPLRTGLKSKFDFLKL